jgi:hypothetical protein
MIFTLTNTGAFFKEGLFLGLNVPLNLFLRLYTNNRGVPQPTDTIANYTECTLAGYAAVQFQANQWTVVTAGGICTATYPQITFTFQPYAGGTTIYGALITDAARDVFLASPLDAVFPVPPGGGVLNMNVQDVLRPC